MGAEIDLLSKATQVAREQAETWAQMRKLGPVLPFVTDAGPCNSWVIPELEAWAFPVSEDGLEMLQCLLPLWKGKHYEKDMCPKKIRKPRKPKWPILWVILGSTGCRLLCIPHPKVRKCPQKSGLCKAVSLAIPPHDNWKRQQSFSPFSENMLRLTTFKKREQYWIPSCSWEGSHSPFHHEGRGTKPQRNTHTGSFLPCSWIFYS